LIDHAEIFFLEGGGKTMRVRASCAERRREPGTSKQGDVGLRNLVWRLDPLKANHIQVIIDTRGEDGILLGRLVEEIIAINVKCTKNNFHVVFRES
jgi:hypothetical protein